MKSSISSETGREGVSSQELCVFNLRVISVWTYFYIKDAPGAAIALKTFLFAMTKFHSFFQSHTPRHAQ